MFFQDSSCSIERGQNQPIRVNFFELITRLFVSVDKNKVIRYHIIAKSTQRPANESICSVRLNILFVALYLQHCVPQAVSFYGIHHARVIISVASCQCTELAIIIKFHASATFKSSILFPTVCLENNRARHVYTQDMHTDLRGAMSRQSINGRFDLRVCLNVAILSTLLILAKWTSSLKYASNLVRPSCPATDTNKRIYRFRSGYRTFHNKRSPRSLIF